MEALLISYAGKQACREPLLIGTAVVFARVVVLVALVVSDLRLRLKAIESAHRVPGQYVRVHHCCSKMVLGKIHLAEVEFVRKAAMKMSGNWSWQAWIDVSFRSCSTIYSSTCSCWEVKTRPEAVLHSCEWCGCTWLRLCQRQVRMYCVSDGRMLGVG